MAESYFPNPDIGEWESPSTTEGDTLSAADAPHDKSTELDGTPEQLAEDFFSKATADLEVATTPVEVNKAHDYVFTLFQEGKISEEQYDSFMASYREKFKIIEGQIEINDFYDKLQYAPDISSISGTIDRVTEFYELGRITESQFMELQQLAETKKLELQNANFQNYVANLRESYGIPYLDQALKELERMVGYGNITEAQLTELKQVAETRRAEIQQSNADGYAANLRESYGIPYLDQKLKELERMVSYGNITEAQLTELKQVAETRRAEIQQSNADGYAAKLQESYDIPYLDQKLKAAAEMVGYGNITEAQLTELKQVAETRRAEIQQSNAEGYAANLRESYGIPYLNQKLKELERMVSYGNITEAQLTELQQVAKTRREELQTHLS